MKTVVLKTKTECQAVVEALQDLLKRYGYVTLSDLKVLVSLEPTYEDCRVGWGTVDSVDIRRDKHNWLLVLPDPTPTP